MLEKTLFLLCDLVFSVRHKIENCRKRFLFRIFRHQ